MYGPRQTSPTGQTYVVRDGDGAVIPADPANADWRAYQAWLRAGNEPQFPYRRRRP